ncbi:MAG: CmcJ/NvfI family oxidoreductase [Hyphomonadaceae bacterium]
MTEVLDQSRPLSRATVKSEINYFVPNGQRPVIDLSGRERTNVNFAPHQMEISDARGTPPSVSLRERGFGLFPHRSEHCLETEFEPLLAGYHPEMIAFLKNETGARDIIPLRNGLLVRRGARAAVPSRSKPAHFAHLDFTETWANHFIYIGMAWENVKEIAPYRRFAIFQTWRATSEPPQDNTLAVCDASSFSTDDAVVQDFFPRPETVGIQFEAQLLTYNPAHRWNYYSNMTRDEVLVFKAYDSDKNLPRFVPHTAFNNSAVSADAEPRASLEARFLAFFD